MWRPHLQRRCVPASRFSACMHWPFACFSAALLFFHCSEAALAYAFNPQDAGRHSAQPLSRTSPSLLRAETARSPGWLFSWPYAVAMAAACTEYALEWRLAPLVKARVAPFNTWRGSAARAHAAMQGAPALEPVQWLGLVLVVFGEALRKASILTARRNFTHVVQLTRRPGHVLVTHGVYAFVRHPGYLGWFIWAVSTQARCRSSWRSAFWAPLHACSRPHSCCC